jgi:GT2 family glycosyltransferase
MQDKGWGVEYLPQARVLHYQGQSMKKQTGKKVGAHKDGLICFYAKYHSRLATAVFISVLWLGYGSHAIGWLVGHPFGRKGGFEKFRRYFSGRRLGSDS